MKTQIFILVIFCFGCTKIEYVIQPPVKVTINIDSIKIINKKPVKPIDTVTVIKPKIPYILKDIDGNVYDSVIFGSQVWLATNLRTTKYNDGSVISNITDTDVWKVLLSPAMCWYNDGALYNWHAVNTGKLCPIGWHVPSDDEWKALELFLGMAQNAVDSLVWRGEGLATVFELSAFKLLFTGYRSGWYGDFGDYGFGAYLWTSTSYDQNLAYARSLVNILSSIWRYMSIKTSGFSVRCIKN